MQSDLRARFAVLPTYLFRVRNKYVRKPSLKTREFQKVKHDPVALDDKLNSNDNFLNMVDY